MKPININDVHPKVGDVLQTVNDFVVVELVDDGPVPVCHARSLRGGQPTIVAPGSIRGIMIPVFQAELDANPFRNITPSPVPEKPVVEDKAPLPPEKPKGYEIVRGPQQPAKPRHQHNMPAPPTPKLEPAPSITQEPPKEEPKAT